MDDHQREFLERKLRGIVAEDPKMQELHDLLLSHGGEMTCLPRIEEDFDAILTRGRIFKPRWLRMMPGRDCGCHFNVARLWDVNKDRVRICTGYGLSDDRIWRQHSWGLFKKQVVVETTVERILYFGFIMTPDEAEQFFFDNGF